MYRRQSRSKVAISRRNKVPVVFMLLSGAVALWVFCLPQHTDQKTINIHDVNSDKNQVITRVMSAQTHEIVESRRGVGAIGDADSDDADAMPRMQDVAVKYIASNQESGLVNGNASSQEIGLEEDDASSHVSGLVEDDASSQESGLVEDDASSQESGLVEDDTSSQESELVEDNSSSQESELVKDDAPIHKVGELVEDNNIPHENGQVSDIEGREYRTVEDDTSERKSNIVDSALTAQENDVVPEQEIHPHNIGEVEGALSADEWKAIEGALPAQGGGVVEAALPAQGSGVVEGDVPIEEARIIQNAGGNVKLDGEHGYSLKAKVICPIEAAIETANTHPGFDCSNFKYTGKPIACQSDISFYTKSEILEGLRSKWLFLIGDSTTRAMAMALIEQLDDVQQHPYDSKTWYNVTDEGEEAFWLGEHWRGRAGDFQKLDYIFRRDSSSGEWSIVYKKASGGTVFAPSPEVFLRHRLLSSDEVRISYCFIRDSKDLDHVWKTKVPGTPDIVYVNFGAWLIGHEDEFNCDLEVLKDIKSSVSQLIWGTIEDVNYSYCDKNITGLNQVDGEQCILGTRANAHWATSIATTALEDFLIVDRTLILRTRLRESLRLDGYHHVHVANLYDVMQLFKVLGWEQSKMMVDFSPFCPINSVGIANLTLQFNITSVPLPDQGWKSPWKLPCRYRVN